MAAAAAAAASAAVAAANRNQFSLPKDALGWVAKNRCNPHAAYEVALRELGAGTLLTDCLDNYLTKVNWNAVERRTNSYFDQLTLFRAGQDVRTRAQGGLFRTAHGARPICVSSCS